MRAKISGDKSLQNPAFETSSQKIFLMNENHLILIAKELSVPVMQVAATAKLLGDGATVPFIARYRKEATVPSTKSR